MGADYYQSDDQRAAVLAAGGVPVGIGEGCTITNAIVDKNACIGKVRPPALLGGDDARRQRCTQLLCVWPSRR